MTLLTYYFLFKSKKMLENPVGVTFVIPILGDECNDTNDPNLKLQSIQTDKILIEHSIPECHGTVKLEVLVREMQVDGCKKKNFLYF